MEKFLRYREYKNKFENLRSFFFNTCQATNDSVVAVNNQNYETYACIVRPNRNADQNEDFIKNKLCNGRSSNYLKVIIRINI